jgi:UDPglucose 6-dehydrogenase
VALCQWLVEQGAVVRAHDSAITQRAPELPAPVELCPTVDDAIRGADATVVATEWPRFRELSAEQFTAGAKRPLVLDANRFLAGSLGADPRVQYFAVGASSPVR